MALTVRYPNGQAITYNSANSLVYGDDAWHLYTKNKSDGGLWVASIQLSAGVIVEWNAPCKIENPLTGLTHRAALETVAANLREISHRGGNHELLRALKRDLARFDARTGDWRDA